MFKIIVSCFFSPMKIAKPEPTHAPAPAVTREQIAEEYRRDRENGYRASTYPGVTYYDR